MKGTKTTINVTPLEWLIRVYADRGVPLKGVEGVIPMELGELGGLDAFQLFRAVAVTAPPAELGRDLAASRGVLATSERALPTLEKQAHLRTLLEEQLHDLGQQALQAAELHEALAARGWKWDAENGAIQKLTEGRPRYLHSILIEAAYSYLEPRFRRAFPETEDANPKELREHIAAMLSVVYQWRSLDTSKGGVIWSTINYAHKKSQKRSA